MLLMVIAIIINADDKYYSDIITIIDNWDLKRLILLVSVEYSKYFFYFRYRRR